MDAFKQDSVAFFKWFSQSEDTRASDKIRIADLRAQGAGRAVVATQDIGQDEELFAVPKHLVLHPQTSSLTKNLNDPLPDSDPWLPLIVTIIYELLRADESPWMPYLHLLPDSFDTLMFWSEEELALLKGSEVVNKIGKETAEDTWRETIIPFMLKHPDLFPTAGQTAEDKTIELIRLSHRAGSLIMCSAFDIDKDDEGEGHSSTESSLVSDDEEDLSFKGMVPFADLLNADADRNNARLFQEDDYLLMRAITPIKAGNEVFNDYGPLPRSDLLRMYGYITPNYVQYDVVELSQQDFRASAMNTKKEISDDQSNALSALDELGLLEDAYIIQRPSMQMSILVSAIPAELHMLLRALTCNLGNNASVNEKRLQKAVKEDITIEEASLLAAVCTKRLKDYPTTIEEDDILLQKLEHEGTAIAAIPNASPQRLKMAIEVRKGEKEILRAVISLCQDHIASRTSEIREAARTTTKRKHQGEAGRVTEMEKAKKKSKQQGFR